VLYFPEGKPGLFEMSRDSDTGVAVSFLEEYQKPIKSYQTISNLHAALHQEDSHSVEDRAHATQMASFCKRSCRLRRYSIEFEPRAFAKQQLDQVINAFDD
jgi:hypothetical protein